MNPARILIVEDEAILAAHLALSLGQMGYQAAGQAATGEAAIALALKEKPDAILMDIRLRGEMTGIQAAEAIHKISDIPIVYLTAYTEESVLQQAMISEAYSVLAKPVRERELRASLEMALYKHGAESQLRRLNQVLRAVRDVNHLITHERDPQALLEEACRILVRTRDYILVWIGKVDPLNGAVQLAAKAGDVGDALTDAMAVRNGLGPGRMAADRAVRDQKPEIVNDVRTVPDFLSWKETAEKYGVVAVAAIPVPPNREMVGVLTVYSDRPGLFGAEEVHLLTELAGDLAYALEALRDETARRTAEAALQESESKFRNVFQNSRDPIVVSHAGLHVFENQAYLQVYGYETPGELADRPVLDLVAASHRDQIASYIRNRGAGQEAPGFYESRGLRKNGSEFDTEIQASTFELQGRVHILAIIRDITERKKNEERLRQGNRELREAFQSSIRALSSAIEMRDPYTAGHQERVTRLSVAIAREMGLDDDKVEGIRIAGMVHDIGKLSIPAEILSKPTKLQPIEYSMIQSHPLSGFTILENIPFPWPIARIVLQHHERMDGSGYPNKLAGEAILIEARIIAVADVVEAMSSHRPYRPALEPQEAMKEIRGGKGTVYDPAVVDACIRVISRPDFSFN
jgi:PAS domain S-box-containing protein